ncbi:31115_t:CDS:2, partial [Racocetra persica]
EGPSTFSSKTSPISIPQSQKDIVQPILSPSKNLNPNAPVFVPQSLNSSLLSGAGEKINISSKQLEGMKKNRDSGNESSVNKDENDEEFVYPKSDEDEFVYDSKDSKDSDDEFFYGSSSNDEMVFPHDISIGNTENSNVPEITVKFTGNT